jgi:restriction system protein
VRRAVRWLALECVVWALVGLGAWALLRLVLPPAWALPAALALAGALAAGSWGARGRAGWARARGLRAADGMSGADFEAWLAVLFRDRGWRVTRTRASGDFGADLILARRGERVSVQAKRRDRPVGVQAVQEAATARLHYGADRAMVVTNQGFTRAARELAESAEVELWGREEVARELLGRRPVAPSAHGPDAAQG